MIDERKNDSVSSAVQARLDELFEETNTPCYRRCEKIKNPPVLKF